MSHNITSNDRQEGLVQAWHGLTVVRKDLSLDRNWLAEWDVKRMPLFIYNGNPKPVLGEYEEPTKTPWDQLVCTDDPSLLVGKPIGSSYGEITNAEFLDMIREAIGGTGHVVQSVGSVRSRGRVFVTVKLDQDTLRKISSRTFQDYLTFGNSHDLSSELFVVNTSICTVCDNTFSMNLSTVRGQVEGTTGAVENGTDVRLRHSKHARIHLPAIAKVLDKAIGIRGEFYHAFEQLDNQATTTKTAERILTAVEASQEAEDITNATARRVADQLYLFRNGRGNQGKTLADLFSATTDYYTHLDIGDMQRTYESSEYGTGASRKRRMFDTLTNPERLEKAESRGAKLLETVVLLD